MAVADYTSDSAADRLLFVRTQMAVVMKSQEYRVASRMQQMALLRDFIVLERNLIEDVAAEGGDFSPTLIQVDAVD